VGDDRHHPAAEAADEAGPRSRTERGQFGQPDGQDAGKGGPRGYDAGKKTNGRKRHYLVETDGLLLRVKVHAADIQDYDGARLVLAGTRVRFPRLRRVWTDGMYRGALVPWAKREAGVELGIVAPPKGTKGSRVLPRRWVVERSIARMGRYRRLSKDYEATTETSEAMIYAAFGGTMLRKLVRRRAS